MASRSPFVPMEEVEAFFCDFCAQVIPGETFPPDENHSTSDFAPDDINVQSTGMGYVHKHCILPQIAEYLTSEEKLDVVKLVNALRIINDFPDELVHKLDRNPMINTFLSGLKEKVEEQLNELDQEPCAFSETKLIFCRVEDVVTAKVALLGEVCRLQLEIGMPATRPVQAEIKADRLAYLLKAANGLSEVTA